jgi:hypothetical protein
MLLIPVGCLNIWERNKMRAAWHSSSNILTIAQRQTAVSGLLSKRTERGWAQ